MAMWASRMITPPKTFVYIPLQFKTPRNNPDNHVAGGSRQHGECGNTEAAETQ